MVLFAEYYAGLGNTNEMITKGRLQYQLLRERGNLPKFGSCWKSAVEHVDEGCRELSEETQSDIALLLTNCFLQMSGHETYSCTSDRKPNVRAICISTMSDRAFNVYTEFYSHTLNMCWFLRGQIWQETISENTLKVGKQLAMSAEKQEKLLEVQQESYKQLEHSARKQEKLLEIQQETLDVQEKMLHHGRFIEGILNELTTTTKNHQEMLMILSQSVNSLQTWMVGEISWLNSLFFYSCFSILTIVFTSTSKTIISRLPILCMIITNLFLERFVCYLFLKYSYFNADNLFSDIQGYIWALRYFLIFLSLATLLYKALFHVDLNVKNQLALESIIKQNKIILSEIQNKNLNISDLNGSFNNKPRNIAKDLKVIKNGNDDFNSSFIVNFKAARDKSTPSPTPSKESARYNLRSRQGTPTVI